MNILVRKISDLGLLKLELAVGALIMAAAVIGLPLGIASVNLALLINPYVFGIVLIGILAFGSVGYFFFVRPYLLYQKIPAVQAETDGEFLYIHSKKEAKIPLSELADATVFVELPYILQKEFLHELIIHLGSEEYGNILLEVPKYGKYRMYFVSYAQAAANELEYFMHNATNNF